MEIGEVLIINSGLVKPYDETKDNLHLHHTGIPDITEYYSAIILEWCGYASIEKNVRKKQHIVSEDLKTVIQKVQEKLQPIKPKYHPETPIIISSQEQSLKGFPSTYLFGAKFLARRILSGHDTNNNRRIGIVRKRVTIGKQVMNYIKHYRRKYPQLEIILQDRVTLLESLAKDHDESDTYDFLVVPHFSNWVYPIDEESLNEDFLEEKRIQRKSRRKRIIFSSEEELGEMGIKTFLEKCQEGKTLRCGELCDDYGCLDARTIECLVRSCCLEIDIPDFLDKCPKV